MKYSSKKVEVLFHRQVLIKRKTSGHVSHLLPDLFVILHNIEPVHRSRPTVGKQQCSQDAEECTLTGSIRSDDAEQLTGIHGKGNLLQGFYFTVTFSHVTDRYSWFHHQASFKTSLHHTYLF